MRGAVAPSVSAAVGAVGVFPERLRRGVLLAPLLLVAHVLEESPGFVAWFNAHVARGITQDLFWTVNLTGLAITVVVALGFWAARSDAAALVVVAWLGFLMLANALLHITGAILDRAYVPGLATAIGLYVPYCGWVGWELASSRRFPASVLVGVALLGGLPMAVHGYLILFHGSRLF